MKQKLEIDISEATKMLNEIMEFVAWGLYSPDIMAKQFFLERILITGGQSLKEFRENNLGICEGIMPKNYGDYLEKGK
jgi:hypothetical protein